MYAQTAALATLTVTVEGDAAEQLLAMPAALRRRVARAALRKSIGLMEAAIKSRIRSRSGLLASKTRARFGKGDRPNRYSIIISSMATAGTYAKGRDRVHRHAEANSVRARHASSDRFAVFYGRFVDAGHGGKHPAAPHPFATAGFDATVETTAEITENALVEGIIEKAD